MRFVFRYVKKYTWFVILSILAKTTATFMELLIPYILEHLLDNVAPGKNMNEILIWSGIMVVMVGLVWALNVYSNRRAVKTSARCAYEIRRDLFRKSIRLSGRQFDEFGLPSITSRMTSDSYNLQDFTRMFQSIGIRAPLMLFGGIIVSMSMDKGLGLILCAIAPITLAAVLVLSFKGIPLYERVQQSLDNITRIMRENITGIRVVKALSKENFERERYSKTNEEMYSRERKAGTIMALPAPIMTMFLNMGLTAVVLIGAMRVNSGRTEPGVILAFLTYFNMILMGTMGLSRVLLMMSKANASAIRVAAIINREEDLVPIPVEQAAVTKNPDYIVFEDVSFRYGADSTLNDVSAFAGEERKMSLENISFSIPKGGSLGIIGPTGCGKTTIVNLLMRFYDATEGNVFVDGRDVRTYTQEELHRKFGVVFQNDMVFADTLAENIKFGREVSDEEMRAAAADACIAGFIESHEQQYEQMSAAHGANFSGGQKQRILISRALAANVDILVLDDASSALDYKTDAALRKAIREHHSSATTIIIAQRISSIMMLDRIMVMEEGRIIGLGTHEELLKSCPGYLDIYNTQMGEES
ncbi:MAG: ABC transporter ATP-binding protein [Lachnospiraceae bacterium]|jgi:ATP-binding cassette subfamily B multidrug efflux pump